MTSKHTPGPWTVEPDARVGSITITHTDGGNRSHLAVLPQATLCPEHGNLMANARLIAAAPKMLAALEAIKGLGLVTFAASNPGRHILARTLADIDRWAGAAIAKATGGER